MNGYGKSMKHALFLFLFLSASLFAEEPADIAFQKKDYATAKILYGEARNKDKANWLRYSAQIVRCCMALGDSDQAVLEFFVICRDDPQTALYDCIPLPWNPPPTAPGAPKIIEKMATEFLDPLKNRSPGEAAVLLAAGVLSVSAQATDRERGLTKLRQLASMEGSVAQLASAMLWKQKIPTLRTPNELAFLENAVERMPEPLRAGPYFLLGQAAKSVGDREKAVLYWMRLPILYSEQKLLVDAAVTEAADALEKLGRPTPVNRLTP